MTTQEPPVPPPPPLPPTPPVDGGNGGFGPQPKNGLGLAGLICGIVAVVFAFIPVLNWFTWPLGILAIVFGAIGWSYANKGQATNKGMAITGLILGIASFLIFCVMYVAIFGAAEDYQNRYGALSLLSQSL